MKNIIKNKKRSEIHWKSVHIFVYDLQYKIYYHIGKNEIGFVRHYQHKLIKSMEDRFLSVQTVSQDNRGKITAGVKRMNKSFS